MGCFISVLFSAARAGLPGAGLTTRRGPNALPRARIDTEPPDPLPTLAGVLAVGEGETGDCNCSLLQERKGRTQTFLYTCAPASGIPTPRILRLSFLLACFSIYNPSFQISFIMNLKATGGSQQSPISTLKHNSAHTGVRIRAPSPP